MRPFAIHFSKIGGLTSRNTSGVLAKIAVPPGDTAKVGEGGGVPDHTHEYPEDDATLARDFLAR